MPQEHHPEFDARTLAEAEEIKADTRRSVAAREAATRLAGQQAVSAQQLARVAAESPARRPPGVSEAATLQSQDGRVMPITRSTRR